jgi:hypothetical protein
LLQQAAIFCLFIRIKVWITCFLIFCFINVTKIPGFPASFSNFLQLQIQHLHPSNLSCDHIRYAHVGSLTTKQLLSLLPTIVISLGRRNRDNAVSVPCVQQRLLGRKIRWSPTVPTDGDTVHCCTVRIQNCAPLVITPERGSAHWRTGRLDRQLWHDTDSTVTWVATHAGPFCFTVSLYELAEVLLHFYCHLFCRITVLILAQITGSLTEHFHQFFTVCCGRLVHQIMTQLPSTSFPTN